MPYPAKTNARTILATAIEQLEQSGKVTLSMRELASKLGLSPRALYRYYPDRAALEAAIAEKGFHHLRTVLSSAAEGRSGKDALRAGAIAYLTFAHAHPALYNALMSVHEPTPGLLQAEQNLWGLVVQLVGQNVTQVAAESAAVALWAFLHGFIQLESAAVLGERKPRSGFEVGLEAFLSGLTSPPTD